MKKILLGLLVLTLCACTLNIAGDPKDKVKEFLDMYKNQDSSVISDLEDIISSEYKEENKERYKNLMINQYKDMEYDITDEIIEDDEAIVTVDIKVYDYSKAIEYSNNYLVNHKEEFLKDDEIDQEKYTKYKLDELEKVSDKKTYTINFILNKKDNEWVVSPLSNSDIEKIHGLYIE